MWASGSTRPTPAGEPATAASTCVAPRGNRSGPRWGRITFAGSLAGRGVVVVDHGGTRTTYEPVDATVSVGDTVAAGDRIGRLQLGGSHCYPAACLHWGWRDGDTYLDPLTLVGAGPVRLLPLGRDDTGQATLRHSAAWLPTWAVRSSTTPWPRPSDGAGSGPLFRERVS